jgi:hypothetical protein
MSNPRFTSVWDAIEDTPAEAENMKLRSVLMTIDLVLPLLAPVQAPFPRTDPVPCWSRVKLTEQSFSA